MALHTLRTKRLLKQAVQRLKLQKVADKDGYGDARKQAEADAKAKHADEHSRDDALREFDQS